jgi:hypothetical protein
MTSVKPHSVSRLYKAGSWETLEKIVCNRCKVEKTRQDNFSVYKYTCKPCAALKPARELDNHLSYACDDADGEGESAEDRGHVRVQRKYKNGSWASLDTICCGKCEVDKPRAEFKINRYVCIECSNAKMRELNKKKDAGKYNDLQKQYNARYETTEHGRQRRAEYREKMKEQRAQTRTRKPNPMNRLRIYTRQRIAEALSDPLIKASPAMQYLGVTVPIFKSWIEYNFEGDMTWENLGVVWKPDIIGDIRVDIGASEKNKYDALNWRKWYPRGADPIERDYSARSAEFFTLLRDLKI